MLHLRRAVVRCCAYNPPTAPYFGPLVRCREYGLQVNVSLLNADPAQTRFEAAFIAQAGLPQSVSLASCRSMYLHPHQPA